jgi:pimeloyl-ACP methyl ester carboxylesterase
MSEFRDDDLEKFAADGALPLPAPDDHGYVEHDGARIWYAIFGAGSPVILLHGGNGHSGNWGYQVPVLIDDGFRVIVIDSRGHGRSTRDNRPFTYQQMASDVVSVMDHLDIQKAAFVGWSDGAVVALTIGMGDPERVSGVFFFACNVDPSGAKEITELSPILDRCLDRHAKDYVRLSSTPDEFKAFHQALSIMMTTQPNYIASDLGQIRIHVTIVHSERDEFITREHAEYLARTILHAKFVYLPGVSHFAPLQRPALFNTAVLTFVRKLR